MLVNPYHTRFPTYDGTRLLQSTFGLVGTSIPDPVEPTRTWTVTGLYAPISRRALGGLRVKLVDNKDFFTFCNQLDFEVLLDLARPGDWCHWASRLYSDVNENDWYGFCVDENDLVDDLYERELGLREHYPVTPMYFEITRRAHLRARVDIEELLLFLGDTTMGEPYIETVEQRWSRVERNEVVWINEYAR